MDHSAEIVKLLQASGRPLAFGEISPSIPLPARTLRRLLALLVDTGVIQAEGERKARKYIFCPKSDTTLSEIFSQKSMQILSLVQASLVRRDPCTYREAWLDAYIPNQSFYLSETQRKVLREQGARFNKEMPAGTYAKKIFNRLLIDLSYNSSRLEGNTYSLLNTERLVIEGTPSDQNLDLESVMIINHKEAIQFLVEGINRIELTIDNIRSLHYLLSDGLITPGQAGHVREESVRISSTTYSPLEGKERLEGLLFKIIEKAKNIDDAYEQSFFLLVHLSYLQAFADVNKRTARLAANIPLVRYNLVPLSFNDISKDDYISAIIAIYELNNTLPLSELYSWSYLRGCKQYDVISEAMYIDTIRVLYRQQRRALISEVVLKKMNKKTASDAVSLFSKKYIPEEHRSKFLEDVSIDLNTLDPSKIAGMGITLADLETWKGTYESKD